MKIISSEYRIKANEIRKNIKIDLKEISNLKVSENNNEIKNMYLNKKTNIEDDFLVNTVEITKNEIEEDNLASKIEIFTKTNEKIELNFESNIDKNPNNWIDIKKISNNSNEFKFKIIMYLDHSFFKPYTGNNDFLLIMRKFIIAFASSIIELRYVQFRKQIDPITLVSFINSYLLEIKE